MDQVRKIYHRALVIPMVGIESIWHGYDGYENSLNKVTVHILQNLVENLCFCIGKEDVG